jgi:hypothetical protein
LTLRLPSPSPSPSGAIRSGKSISYAEARVLDGDGALLAHGTSTLMTLPGKGLKISAPKFLDGVGACDR